MTDVDGVYFAEAVELDSLDDSLAFDVEARAASLYAAWQGMQGASDLDLFPFDASQRLCLVDASAAKKRRRRGLVLCL